MRVKGKGMAWLRDAIARDAPHCMLYPYAKDQSGYGLVGVGPGRHKRAHREAFRMYHGGEPEVVMHTCDNPACCNPAHLQAGTKALNNADRARKGRSARRVPSRQALTADDVAAICKRYSPARVGIAAPNGVTQLARDYGVDAVVIYRVLKGLYHVGA